MALRKLAWWPKITREKGLSTYFPPRIMTDFVFVGASCRQLSERGADRHCWVDSCSSLLVPGCGCDSFGCGSKLNRRGYADFGPCFHFPGFHFGTGFWSHSHLSSQRKSVRPARVPGGAPPFSSEMARRGALCGPFGASSLSPKPWSWQSSFLPRVRKHTLSGWVWRHAHFPCRTSRALCPCRDWPSSRLCQCALSVMPGPWLQNRGGFL